MTARTLASGISGAIGCDFDRDANRLYFVEYGGKVSRLDLLGGRSRTVSSGSATIKGTFLFDFDGGHHSPTRAITDVWWRQQTSVRRRMEAQNGAELALIGKVSFGSVTAQTLRSLTYGTEAIQADDNAGNQLPNGTVFAVRTSSGNYAKVLVTQYGYNIKVKWVTYKVSSGYKVLGTGYDRPEDIALTADASHAYVTERGGKLLRVKLSSAARSAATVVSSGMRAPHQISLDEAAGQAYVVEFANSGRLFRINLADGKKTQLAAGLKRAIGLLMSADKRFAYVSLQAPSGHRVERIDLAAANREVIASGLSNPFFMTWTDPVESGILLAERDPANRLAHIDLTKASPKLTRIASGLPARPSSAALVTSTRALVCSDSIISEVDLSAGYFSATGPLLMGVGHVPKDRISQSGPATARGYADTTVDPGYFFQVKDAPFGGTLSLMFNHNKAYASGARYYRLWIGSVEPKQSFSDYKWSSSVNRFLLETTSPSASGYYRVRHPSQIWYNNWLAYRLGTGVVADGLYRIRVRTYKLQSGASQVATDSFLVRIDNQRATASIDQILHYHTKTSAHPVDECAIIDRPLDAFRFRVTAWDPQGHLKSYQLSALWGNNKSKSVAGHSYAATPSKKWFGLPGSLLPSSGSWQAEVAGDPTSTRCAHTFYLTVWDRVINGYGHIHKSTYHKSITIMLP